MREEWEKCHPSNFFFLNGLYGLRCYDRFLGRDLRKGQNYRELSSTALSVKEGTYFMGDKDKEKGLPRDSPPAPMI